MARSLPLAASVAGRAPIIPGDAIRVLAAFVGLGVLGWLGETVRPQLAPEQSAAQVKETAGWEARRMVAQIYWLKTHSVMHAGIEEREALPGELEARASDIVRHKHTDPPREGSHAEQGHEEHGHDEQGHDEQGHDEHGHDATHETAPGNREIPMAAERRETRVLTIPSARHDFRGFLGDLERATKPYLAADGKMYAKPLEQTLPYYRVVTWIDPHFVEAYVVGATMISDAGQHVREAEEYLLEGARHNPESFEIQTELGHFALVYRQDYPSAARHLEAALRLVPADRKLSDVQTDSLQDAWRWLALTYREWGQPDRARRVARAGLAVIGEDISLRGILRDARPSRVRLYGRPAPG